MLPKTLSGPDRVFEANSKPQTQPDGVVRGRGEGGGAGKGTGQFLLKRTQSGPDRVFCSEKPYLGQIGFLKPIPSPKPNQEGWGGAGKGRGGAGKGTGQFLLKKPYLGQIGFFLLKKTLSGPDRVVLLPKTLSGPDRVFEANSKPQNQPGGASGSTACWCQTRSLIWLNFGFLTSLIWRKFQNDVADVTIICTVLSTKTSSPKLTHCLFHEVFVFVSGLRFSEFCFLWSILHRRGRILTVHFNLKP